MTTPHFHRGPPPPFALTFPPSLSPYDKPAAQWLLDNDKHFDGLATGAHVFDAEGRVLLVQRAAHDSMPNRWETPGGAADPEDASLLGAAARELWEETGLRAGRVVGVVTEGEGRGPGSMFTNRTGRRIFCRFAFEVEVEEVGDGVRLDPGEHQDWVWATEGEVREGRVGGREIVVTNGQMMRLILEGFRLRRERAREEECVKEGDGKVEVGEGEEHGKASTEG